MNSPLLKRQTYLLWLYSLQNQKLFCGTGYIIGHTIIFLGYEKAFYQISSQDRQAYKNSCNRHYGPRIILVVITIGDPNSEVKIKAQNVQAGKHGTPRVRDVFIVSTGGSEWCRHSQRAQEQCFSSGSNTVLTSSFQNGFLLLGTTVLCCGCVRHCVQARERVGAHCISPSFLGLC